MKPAPKVLRRGEWGWPTKPVPGSAVRGGARDRPATAIAVPAWTRARAWCFAQNWQAAAAERGYSSYAMSLRGHGGSGGQTRLGRTTLRDYVHDVLQVISSLDQPPVLVAHSLGTLVAQRAAALSGPARVYCSRRFRRWDPLDDGLGFAQQAGGLHSRGAGRHPAAERR